MKINELIEARKNAISKNPLYIKNDKGEEVEVGTLTILCGDFGSLEPEDKLNEIVKKYVEDKKYIQFIDINLDNPWVRVIIEGINELDYEEFMKQKL